MWLLSETWLHFLTLLRNKFEFWSFHGIMNTSDLLQRKWSPKQVNLQETQSIHDSMNRPKIEFTIFIYYQSSVNFHLTSLVFRIFWIKFRHNRGLGKWEYPNFDCSFEWKLLRSLDWGCPYLKCTYQENNVE